MNLSSALVLERGTMRRGFASVALVLGLAACGEDDSRAKPDRVEGTTASVPDSVTTSAPAKLQMDDCALAGEWTQCKVEKRLENAGLVPVLLPAAEHEPVTSVPTLVYRLGAAELHVWVFPDSSARIAEAARLDPATSQPLGSLRRWPRPAVTIASINLLAVLMSENERTTERIQLALNAGLPAG